MIFGECDYCKAKAIVEVNGLKACKAHIDKAMSQALTPLHKALGKATNKGE